MDTGNSFKNLKFSGSELYSDQDKIRCRSSTKRQDASLLAEGGDLYLGDGKAHYARTKNRITKKKKGLPIHDWSANPKFAVGCQG